MSIDRPGFSYSNMPLRPAGRLITAAGAILPGVRHVQAQIAPFAREWEAANQRSLAGNTPLWVALGDSMTQGIGAPSHDLGYVGQLAGLLAAAGRPHRLVNLAVSGARVVDVLEHQLPALRALDATPALVTVLIGSNDIFARQGRDGFIDRVRTMLRELPDGSVVATLANPNRSAQLFDAEVAAVAGPRGAGARLVLAEMRVPRLRSWRGRLAADHFHPNELGYRGLAAVFADAVGIEGTSASTPDPGTARSDMHS